MKPTNPCNKSTTSDTFLHEVTSDKRTDVIYILNMKDNNNLGWTELKHIKCPIVGSYCAILDSHNNVHLFTKYNKQKVPKHCSINILSILGNISDTNDDIKCSECDLLRAEKNSLQSLMDQMLNNQNKLESEIINLKQQLKTAQQTNNEECKQCKVELAECKQELM